MIQIKRIVTKNETGIVLFSSIESNFRNPDNCFCQHKKEIVIFFHSQSESLFIEQYLICDSGGQLLSFPMPAPKFEICHIKEWKLP